MKHLFWSTCRLHAAVSRIKLSSPDVSPRCHHLSTSYLSMVREHDTYTRSMYRRLSTEQRIALFGAVLPNMQSLLELKSNEALRRILAPPLAELTFRVLTASGRTPPAAAHSPLRKRGELFPTEDEVRRVVIPDPHETALSVACALGRILDAEKVPYAIGGALSFGFWAVPRTTFHVDFNYFTTTSAARRMLEALENHTSITDEYGAVVNAVQIPCDGAIIRFWWKGTKIEAFGPTIPVFSQQAFDSARRLNVNGTSLSVLSAEAIAVFQLIFARPKDWVDLEALVESNPDLDKHYIRDTILTIFDKNPELPAILGRWDEIAQDGPR